MTNKSGKHINGYRQIKAAAAAAAVAAAVSAAMESNSIGNPTC